MPKEFHAALRPKQERAGRASLRAGEVAPIFRPTARGRRAVIRVGKQPGDAGAPKARLGAHETQVV